MAPVITRQLHAVLFRPRPSQESHAPATATRRFVHLKAILELLAGTICIFVLAVLFWKLGKYFRSWTRHRVLQTGTPGARYSKTWHGWVPLQQHNAHKDTWRRCTQKLHEWTAWKSTNADYRWVWWDPGQKEFEKYKQNRRLLRWLPSFVRSYSFTPADVIWNPGAPRKEHGKLESNVVSSSSALMAGARRSHGTLSSVCNPSMREGGLRVRKRPNIPSSSGGRSQEITSTGEEEVYHTPLSHILSTNARVRSEALPPLHWSRSSGFEPPMYGFKYYRSRSLPCLSRAITTRGKIPSFSRPSRKPGTSINHRLNQPDFHSLPRNTRKYQIWSIRMELQAAAFVRRDMGGLTGPPGTPMTELLTSISSDPAVYPFMSGRSIALTGHHTSESSILTLPSATQHTNFKRSLLEFHQSESMIRWKSEPLLCTPDPVTHSIMIMSLNRYRGQVFFKQKHWASSSAMDNPTRHHDHDNAGNRPERVECPSTNQRYQIAAPSIGLRNWEERMIDGLDRKLEWLSSQIDPGRRPFHFTLLPNHWLNWETWVVVDPASRVPIPRKRLLGDPRFNKPYPMPQWGIKTKYPEIIHTKAHTPHITSWRKEVNLQRRAFGIREVSVVELFDSSADEPPDGQVDPACWILRKPPQGVALPRKHEDTYYEGGAGWQETLGEWQRVQRGYRIRKAIYEGRANRTRVKEIASGITRYYQMVVSKATQSSGHWLLTKSNRTTQVSK